MIPRIGVVRMLLACSLLIVVTTISTSAQRRPSGANSRSGNIRREAILERDNEIANSDLNFRRLANDAKARPTSPRERKLTIERILDDFKHIQLSSKELRLSISSETINYREVAKLAEDIHKRAKRLKEDLVIPDSESDKSQILRADANSQQVRESLPVLTDLVRRFVTNPLWHNLKVTRIGDLERAKHDIAGVIQLSHDIKKQAARLK